MCVSSRSAMLDPTYLKETVGAPMRIKESRVNSSSSIFQSIISRYVYVRCAAASQSGGSDSLEEVQFGAAGGLALKTLGIGAVSLEASPFPEMMVTVGRDMAGVEGVLRC